MRHLLYTVLFYSCGRAYCLCACGREFDAPCGAVICPRCCGKDRYLEQITWEETPPPRFDISYVYRAADRIAWGNEHAGYSR